MTTGDYEKKSTLRVIFEGTVVSVAGGVVLKIFTILSTIAVLRYVNVYDYGLWQLLLGIIGFITILTLPGLEDLLINDISRELRKDGRRDIARFIFLHSSILIFVCGIIGSVAMLIGSSVVFTITGVNFAEPMRILALFFPLFAIQRIYMLAFYSHLKFVHVQVVKIGSRLSYLLLLGYFVVLKGMGLMGIVYAYALSILIVLALLLPSFLRVAFLLMRAQRNETRVTIWAILKTHGKWALLINYIDNVFSSARPWVIGFFIGVEELAIVSVALSLFSEVTTLLPIGNILGPVLPRHVDDNEKFRRMFAKAMKYSVWFYSAIAILAFIGAKPVVEFLFPQYIPSLIYFYLVIPTVPLVVASTVLAKVFYARREQKGLFFSTLYPKAVSALTILPGFTYFLGPAGVALERVAATFLVFVSRMAMLLKLMPDLSFFIRDVFRIDQDDRDYLRRIAYGFIK